MEKKAYILINKEHVNTHQFTSFPQISRLPEPQQSNLRNVRAPKIE